MIRAEIKKSILGVADLVARLLARSGGEVVRPEAVYITLQRPLGLGDLMMLSPFINAVSRHYHDTPVYLVTEYSPFLSLERADWIHPKALTRTSMAGALVISPTLSWRHLKYMFRGRYFLGYFLSNRLVGNVGVPDYCYSPTKDHYFGRAQAILDSLSVEYEELRYARPFEEVLPAGNLPERYVSISPFCNWLERQYPRSQFVEVIRRLLNDIPVVLIGGNAKDEVQLAQDIVGELDDKQLFNLVGKTSFPQAAGVIRESVCYVGNDSGLTHAAFSLGVPTIVISGCVPGRLRVPLDPKLSERVVVFGHAEECSYYPCYDGYNKPSCRNEQRYVCLGQVCESDVYEAVAEVALLLSGEDDG